MESRVKLYTSLAIYLPNGVVNNVADIEVDEGTTRNAAFTSLKGPLEQCRHVLINSLFVPLKKTATRTMADGNHLAAWPTVAGG